MSFSYCTCSGLLFIKLKERTPSLFRGLIIACRSQPGGLADGFLYVRQRHRNKQKLTYSRPDRARRRCEILFRNAARNIRFSVGIAGAFYASVVVVGLQFVLSQELQLAQSFTPLQAGLFVMPIAMGSIVAGPLLGSVLFRFGAERMMAFALGIATLGLILYTSMWLYSEPFWLIVPLGVTGFGLGGVMSVGSTLIMINAPEDKAGMAGALEGISYELGGRLGWL
ncbi:TPA: MFS transporter [Salmonella enterica]|nr:MFS transporter [Salmonella enterica]